MSNQPLALLSSSLEATALFAQKIGEVLTKNSVLALFGDLGSGKTSFCKALISSLHAIHPEEVVSPTFTYLQVYEANKFSPSPLPIYHFDLYRFSSSQDFQNFGFTEYFQEGGICLIEWAEKIKDLLPKHTVKISLSYRDMGSRWLEVLP